MPILFKDAGIGPSTASLIAALFPLGGIGAIFFGWLMDRFNGNLIIAAGFALTAVAIYAIGLTAGNVALLMLLVFVGGTLMNTAQSSLPALAAAFYPTQGRATGVGWMLGLGRFGGIAGSFLVAELDSPPADVQPDLHGRCHSGTDLRGGADREATGPSGGQIRACRRGGRSAGSLIGPDPSLPERVSYCQNQAPKHARKITREPCLSCSRFALLHLGP